MTIELNEHGVILPPVTEQAKTVALLRAKEVLSFIEEKTTQPAVELALDCDVSEYPTSHLLEKDRGWEPPHHKVVEAYFKQLKAFDPQYTNQGLATFLGLADGRSIRRYTSGEKTVPYDVWRKFLIATGRAPIDMPQILGFFNG